MARVGVVLSGGEVLFVSPAAVQFLLASVRRAARMVERQDGIGLGQGGREVVELLELSRARMSSAAGTTEPAEVGSPPESVVEDLIGTDVVAQLLDCTDSYVRRLCRRGEWETARRVGSKWFVDRAEVLDRIERKAS